MESRDVPAVNVSAQYSALEVFTKNGATVVHVRLLEKTGGDRLPSDVELRSASGDVLARDHTRSGTADLNDMPHFKLPENAGSVTLRFIHKGEVREKVVSTAACTNNQTLDFMWSELTPVSR
jgi:hypothetical protein